MSYQLQIHAMTYRIQNKPLFAPCTVTLESGEALLIHGENGSGKSTLVDALLTLLVPKMKRNYNLSAGGAKKKERDALWHRALLYP